MLASRFSHVKGHARIERGDVRGSIVTELTRHRLPSFFPIFFLFTRVFYFRLRGIFRSAVTGRPKMSRVAVTRWLCFVLSRETWNAKGGEKERRIRNERKRGGEGEGDYYLYHS